MRDRNSDDLTDWEKSFVELNEKMGNDVWGIQSESDGSGGIRLRVYISHESFESKVLEETNGILDGHSIMFTVYSQYDYALLESGRAMSEDLKKRIEEYAENTKAEGPTSSIDGDVQGDSR